MQFLDHLKLLANSYGVFLNSMSALAWAFWITWSIDLGKDMLIKVWVQGRKVEMPARHRHSFDFDGRDVALVVEIGPISRRTDNSVL